jgi:hypothetical protein
VHRENGNSREERSARWEENRRGAGASECVVEFECANGVEESGGTRGESGCDVFLRERRWRLLWDWD